MIKLLVTPSSEFISKNSIISKTHACKHSNVYICNWFIMFTMIYYSFMWNTSTFISLETSLDVNLYPQSLFACWHQIVSSYQNLPI
ncbi:hypothetical protein BLOT_014584 [Blomia tropicalis]|nr:hypothetical protein BLOT_014584 [Blomia tropicalis]